MNLMSILVDLIYLGSLLIASPVLVPMLIIRWKRGYDVRSRLGGVNPLDSPSRPRVLIHAVSVGESNAIETLVTSLLDGPDPHEVVIASTTETGFARASALYGGRCSVVRYPIDLSVCVRRFLNAIRPDVAVMVELELWPNFTSECRRRGIPIAVVNGRLSERSFRRYSRVICLVRRMFGRVDAAAVQTEVYAERFRALGTPASKVSVTGTMKWDSASVSSRSEDAAALAADLGIDCTKPLIVAGSTAPDEHRILRDSIPPGVQLLCAPRRPEWFDDAADVLNGCVRRSSGQKGSDAGLFLLDTIGELGAAYRLADVVVVGRSFGGLHGSDMMEPCALGKPVVVGPSTSDFSDTVEKLLEGDGIIVTDDSGLRVVLHELVDSRERRESLAENAQSVVRAQQGATERTRVIVQSLVAKTAASRSAG